MKQSVFTLCLSIVSITCGLLVPQQALCQYSATDLSGISSYSQVSFDLELAELYRNLDSAKIDLQFAREKLKLHSGPPISGLNLTPEDYKRDQQKVKDLEARVAKLEAEIAAKKKEASSHKKPTKPEPAKAKPVEQNEIVKEDDAIPEIEVGQEPEIPADAVAIVSYVYGLVYVQRGGSGEWEEVGPMTPLRPGDIIRTSRRSKVDLNYRNEYLISLKPMSQIQIPVDYTPNEPKSALGKAVESLKLFFGFIYLNGHKTDGELNIQTPRAVCGVRGTTFSVECGEDGSTRVVVLSGAVAVRANQTGSDDVLVKANQAAMVASDNSVVLQTLSDQEQAAQSSAYTVHTQESPEKLLESYKQEEIGFLTPAQQIEQYQAFIRQPDVDKATDLIIEYIQLAQELTGKDGKITLMSVLVNRSKLQDISKRFPPVLERVQKASVSGLAAQDMKNVYLQVLEDYTHSSRLLTQTASQLDSKAFHLGGMRMTHGNTLFIRFGEELSQKQNSVK